MTITIRNWNRAEFPDGTGNQRAVGDEFTGVSVDVTTTGNNIHDQTANVAASGIVKLFDVTDDLSGGDYIIILADAPGEIEFVGDAAGVSGTVNMSFPMVANLPFIIPGDATRSTTGSPGLFDGAAVTIDQIYFKNTDSANTMKVRIVVAV